MLLAEESGSTGSSDVVWIIDPLDGTTNFMHGFPTFAVSIACQVEPPRTRGGVRSHAPGDVHRLGGEGAGARAARFA
jgi:fructose-1,6-bisphosphatase/inositol monophosphatase family enzyme